MALREGRAEDLPLRVARTRAQSYQAEALIHSALPIDALVGSPATVRRRNMSWTSS